MRRQKRDGEQSSGDPSLLRTCQVCSHAKLRCERTQDSGSCDRCFRLKKTCIFPPARRGAAPAQRVNRIGELEAKIAKLDDILASQQGASGGSETLPVSNRDASSSSSMAAGEMGEESIQAQHANGVSLDPFQLGMLSIEIGEILLDRFKRSLTPYFPFVIIPESTEVMELHREKTLLCLAVLFAASNDDRGLQVRIARLFEQMLATALLQGTISTLENLQGLLVYTTWAGLCLTRFRDQYQPRPRKHTQNIFLAMSIISDLRFHQRRAPLMKERGHDPAVSTETLSPDEVRALVGLYSVTSSASVILNKLRCFPTIPSLAVSCEALARHAENPTDRYLPHVVNLLRISEDVEGLAKGITHNKGDDSSNSRIHNLQYELWSLKETLPPDMASCPFLKIQFHVAELLLGELSLPGSPVGLTLDPSSSLAESISAVKSLMDIFLSAEPGQETCFTSLTWVILGYGLSLGVKLDILCTTCGMSPTTATELRRSLSIAQILRGAVERLRMAIPQDTDADVEPDPLGPFLSRAEEVESWYNRHGPPAALECAPVGAVDETKQDHLQRSALSTHPLPDSVEGVLRPTDSQDNEFAYDPEMLAFEGLDFAGMDFAMDPQEAWNPFVFPDGAF